MDHLEPLEANLRAPAAELRAGVVERIAEFDKHVQGHEQTENILAAGIVNEGFYGYERAARRKGVVDRPDEMHFLLKIPIVEDHAHGDDIGFGKRIFEEIAGCSAD